MKILHVGMGWFPEEAGGLARYMSQAVVAQNELGHSARALVTGSERVHELSRGMALPFALPTASLRKRILSLRGNYRRSVAEFPPDVTAVHFSLYGRPLLGHLRSRPWVVHFHGPWSLEGSAEGASKLASLVRHNLIERPLYQSAPRLITLSRCFAEILTDHYGVDPSRIRVVPGGFDPRPFLAAPDRASARIRLGLPLDRPILVCVRRLASRMGLENLLEAVARLRNDHPDLLLLVAGKGPLRAVLEKRIDELSISGNVRLLGFVPDEDLPVLYSAANLSVVPTVALEGFGLVVAESLATGTPVVASNVGALPELLGGFRDDLLADPTAEGIASALGRFLSQPDQLPTSAACRERTEGWTWARVAPALLSVYEEAIEDWTQIG